MDLWAREHYKSTIITYGLTIQDILNDPEMTVGIFSHTRPIAKAFLKQIKREFETNDHLKAWFPDILWRNPAKESPKWSEDEGIIVKRLGNPKESTVEAWGLVDGQPTSKHFTHMVYDDVVTRESVTTPEMIEKVTDAWALSRNLGSRGGVVRYIGTRYLFGDTYKVMMDRKAAAPRVHPATEGGTMEGEPVLLTSEELADKRREQGPYVFGCQMLQNPKADASQGFQEAWLQYWDADSWAGMNLYILCDPANEKKKTSDYTVFWVVGLSSDQNYMVVDVIRDRMNLTERADTLFALHRKYRPRGVGYEQYGMQADIAHMEDRQRRENYRFHITPLGGPMPKPDRIKRLIPLFEQGRVFLPYSRLLRDYESVSRDMIQLFVNDEYLAFPVSVHDDMLDALARVTDEDMQVTWPKPAEKLPDRYERGRRKAQRSYMAA